MTTYSRFTYHNDSSYRVPSAVASEKLSAGFGDVNDASTIDVEKIRAILAENNWSLSVPSWTTFEMTAWIVAARV